MQTTDLESGLDGDRDDIDVDGAEEESSVLEGALAGLSGLALGATIIYFAFPYCVNC